jgi:starch-binding outer membrane protein, SusD/RagB family
MKTFKIKIRKSLAVSSLLLAALFCSCNDWLTLSPEDGVTKEDYWTTKEEVYASLIGCYSAMIADGMPEKMFMWGELRGETIMPNIVPERVQNIMDGDIVSTNAITSWSQFYTVINQCNTLIKFAYQAQKSDDSFTDALLAQYQSEAVAIRSLMYFYLVRTFRDVPYITEAIVSDDQSLQIEKTEGSVILDSLTHDLEIAAPKLATRFGNDPAVNKGRFTAYGVYSLLADIYIWQEDYDGCIRNCDKVINSGQVSLLYADGSNRYQVLTNNALTGEIDTIYYAVESDASELFKKLYVDGNSDESIFELQRESDFSNNDYYDMFYPNGYFYARVDVIKDLYFIPSEIDRAWYDIRTEGISYKGNYIWKHMGTAREGAALSNIRTRTTMTGNTIIYRLADIMLLKAEALVQKAKIIEGNDTTQVTGQVKTYLGEAWDIVKTIRNRANATESTDLFYGINDASGLSVTTMEKFVYEERIRELMFEGKRWFDALRHAKRNNYEGNNIDYLKQIATYGASAAKVSNLQKKLNNKDFHYLPINQSEIEANKKLVQNPFYI